MLPTNTNSNPFTPADIQHARAKIVQPGTRIALDSTRTALAVWFKGAWHMVAGKVDSGEILWPVGNLEIDGKPCASGWQEV